MVQSKLTFGCGELLPGTGIFSFPNFVPGPGVDNPPPGGGSRPNPWVIDPDPGIDPNEFDPDPGGGGGNPCDGVQCPPGQTCNPQTGQCEGQIDNCAGVSCPPGQTCDPATGQCINIGPPGGPPTTGPPTTTGVQFPPCICVPVGEPFFSTEVIPNTAGCFKNICEWTQGCFSAGPNGLLLPLPSDSFKEKKQSIAGDPTAEVSYGGGCGCNNTNPGCGRARITEIICPQPPGPGPVGVGPGIGNPGGGPDFFGDLETPDFNSPTIEFASEDPGNSNEQSLMNKINKGLRKTFTKVTEAASQAVEVANLFKTRANTAELTVRDNELSFTRNLGGGSFTKNTAGYKHVFADNISQAVNDILKDNGTFNSWDSSSIYNVSPAAILGSLQPSFAETLKSIKKPGGLSMSDTEIADLILSYVIEDDLDNLDVAKLQLLANRTQEYETLQLVTSEFGAQNEIAALALIENNLIPLVPPTEGRANKVLENWKVMATDVDKFVEINIPPVATSESNILEGCKPIYAQEKAKSTPIIPTPGKYYVKDDDTVIDGLPFSIDDGDTLSVVFAGSRYRFPVQSKKDRAFIVPEPVRQQALTILGGDPERKIYASVDASSNVEFEYSLNTDNSAPRQDVYFFKLIPSSTAKIPQPLVSDLVVNTVGRYELMDTNTQAGIDEINEYIKYKYNHRTVFLNHEDILFDYIEATSSITMEQQDVIVEQAKLNPDYPILVRDYPWYLIVIPTNRSDYLLHDTKSQIVNYQAANQVRRQIKTTASLNPEFNTQQGAIFTRTNMEINQLNVSGDPDTQSRTTELVLSASIYDTMYRASDGSFGRPSEVSLPRRKTTFRLMKEIIEELDTNYVLGENARIKYINSFDLLSRLNHTEFNKFAAAEAGPYLYNFVKAGLFNGVQVTSTVNRVVDVANTKTRFVKRRGAASTIDKFPIIKSTNSGRYLQPPDSSNYSARFTDRDSGDISERARDSRLT